MRMMFDDASAVADIVGVMSATIEGNDVVFKVDDSSIKAMQVDNPHVCMASLDLRLDYQDDGSIGNTAHITAAELGDGEFAVGSSLLFSALKQFGREPVIIDVGEDSMVLTNPSMEMTLPLVSTDCAYRRTEPNLTGISTRLAIPSAILTKAQRMTSLGDDMKISLEGSALTFRTVKKEEYGDVEWKTTCWLPDAYPYPYTSSFRSSILKRVLSAMKAKKDGLVGIEIGDDCPVKLIIREGACELRVVIAPCHEE